MSPLPADVAAVRTACAIARTDATRVVRLHGEDARAAASWVLPSRLHLRDAQARQSLLLDEAGRPIADVVVCADDEDYVLLVEGPGDPVAHVRAHARGGVEVTDESEDHEVLEVHGPWAWELVAAVFGDDMLALPYLNFFRVDEGICVRAGRTGEFGYHLVVRRADADALHQKLLTRGAELDAIAVPASTISLAAFESWFFDPAFVPEGVTPIELQLQWRLASDRDFLGRAAIERRRPEVTRLQACVLSLHEIGAGDVVALAGREIGVVTRAAFSHVRGAWIASVLLPRELAHGGIDRFECRGARVRTVAPPLVDNRSLYVDPRRHAYRTRDEISFGPLVRPTRAEMDVA